MTSIKELGQKILNTRLSRRQAIGLSLSATGLAAIEACGIVPTATPAPAKATEAPKPVVAPTQTARIIEVEKIVTATAAPATPKPAEVAAPTATVPAKPAAEATKPAALAPSPQAATGNADLSAARAASEAISLEAKKALENWANARGLVLTVDETEPSWPKRGQGVPAVTRHPEEDLEGNKIPGRSVTELRTGTKDFDWMSGGRFAFIGTANEAFGRKDANDLKQVLERIGFKVKNAPDAVLDPESGLPLYFEEGNKVVIPGGTDTHLRGNVIFVLGVNNDNTSGLFETDSASNYYEKRDIDSGSSAKLNEAVIDAEGVKVLAAMAKVAANSMFNDRNCKGNGCKDAVGVYVVRGGDKTTGKGVQLLWGAVYTGKELSQIKLKAQA